MGRPGRERRLALEDEYWKLSGQREPEVPVIPLPGVRPRRDPSRSWRSCPSSRHPERTNRPGTKANSGADRGILPGRQGLNLHIYPSEMVLDSPLLRISATLQETGYFSATHLVGIVGGQPPGRRPSGKGVTSRGWGRRAYQAVASSALRPD